ncbi:MAG: leucyl aminopeptidase [Candidatus Uhrbacteria bacterium]|nr:leucyl aminopeptidase [Candidatus Uhrbacteria bacterium]
MIDISIKQASVVDQSCDLLVLHLFQGEKPLEGAGGAMDKELGGLISQLLKQDQFEGKLGEWFIFSTLGKAKAQKIAVIGLGDRTKFDLDAVRKIGAHIIRHGRDAKAKSVMTVLPGMGVVDFSTREVAEALAEGLRLGAYRFHAYKGKSFQEKEKLDVKQVIVCERERGKIAPAERGLVEARILADATILARDLVNTPSMEMTPKKLAEVAQSLAKRGSGISIKILDAAKMEKLGMRAALAVGKGSQHAPVGMHLIYRPKGKIKKKIAVIGKAVTFDSGGLSLKPADGMMTMKCDMAGAAAVIGLFQALPDLAPNVEVHGIFLAVENMPSGTAYRPGDVVKAMNGTMIEVLNTDAEGRVTLADALSYAATLKPDVMIDLATLTGACVVALGEDISGLMSNDRKLAERLLLAAKQSGEGLWELPLFEPYQELIKSKVGDIKNIGGRSAGAITAGLFLSHFVNKIPWAHLDIAGPAYIEKETRPDVPYGGSGSGVRLLARYLQGF